MYNVHSQPLHIECLFDYANLVTLAQIFSFYTGIRDQVYTKTTDRSNLFPDYNLNILNSDQKILESQRSVDLCTLGQTRSAIDKAKE